ncbi:cob(I)yrinic acid a,c-diamide adenosyltransferase [Aliikangiella coralliicola]|uniref:Corrinoid adenosyltransferase n=1 Tax=Aliikangiella coralliicola TaxID=2592383 RepID=A0A545UJG9_9GAMM|nr:cob(I)yrinic acid a,c-diamide adenosyltransferase [Aliikangiella coralliicola]TQV89614.1 cob(I)yrinic acid a,c-diamide adenosyltransferase [Aliikangiella coralliicola]
MGNRLSKLATKTGDDGTTGIGGNQRLDKDSARIEAIGTVDELNAAIGMTLSQPVESDIASTLGEVQHRLFDLGGELAMPGYTLVKEEHVVQLDDSLETFNQQLPPLKEFVLPKGDLATTSCHLARTICRRAERRIVTLARTDEINDNARIYLNRLSDLLFVFCRILARVDNAGEEMWQSKRIRANDTPEEK